MAIALQKYSEIEILATESSKILKTQSPKVPKLSAQPLFRKLSQY